MLLVGCADWAATPTQKIMQASKAVPHRERISRFWTGIPEKNRGWLEVVWLIHYEDIVAIDGDGDMYTNGPHIYVPFDCDRIERARLKVNNQTV